MPNQFATVSQAAQQLGVSPSTVRRLCGEYAAHLSPGASPSAGSYRRLSQVDLQTLSEVIRMRNEGLLADTIKEQLSSMVFSPALTESPQVAQGGPGGAIVPWAMVEALESVQRRLEDLEAQRTRIDVVFVAVAAFIAGLIVGLAVWWFQ